MSEKIEAFVRPVRDTNGAAGHIFFVYTKNDGSQVAISLSPMRGFLGMEGGNAQVNNGAWDSNHFDWRQPGENAAVSMGSITGDNLSANFGAIQGTYDNTAASRNYFFLSQNFNAVGSSAADNGGL